MKDLFIIVVLAVALIVPFYVYIHSQEAGVRVGGAAFLNAKVNIASGATGTVRAANSLRHRLIICNTSETGSTLFCAADTNATSGVGTPLNVSSTPNQQCLDFKEDPHIWVGPVTCFATGAATATIMEY